MTRSCGDCAACCTVLGVPGLKESHCACPHARPRGRNRCGIYGSPEKPEPCSVYRCMWLDGHFATKDRPADIGVVFDAHDTGDGYVVVHARETRSNASQIGRAADLIAAMQYGVAVVVVPHDNGHRTLRCSNENILMKLRPKLAKLGIRT